MRRAAMILAVVSLGICVADEERHTQPGELRTHATVHSIGMEWDIAGDTNHNAVCTVRYRVAGEEAWRQALNLFRTDYHGWWKSRKSLAKRPYNMLAGSILFLEPGSMVEVQLDLKDPDGGQARKSFTITMRSWPRKPEGGRRLRVAPGEGGGTGTQTDPFRGIPEAEKVARPRDILLLHKGSYGAIRLSKSGKPGRHIVWHPVGDGEVEIEEMTVAGSHVWIEGFTFRNDQKKLHALRGTGDGRDVVVRGNRFTGFGYSITCDRRSRDWTITDNVIVGDRIPGEESPRGRYSGEGIELAHSEGHVVAYNSITHVADGISYSDRNCDIFGNDIFDTADDGIEPDYGYSNVRIWGNRITNSQNYHISFQPQFCGPWYIIRNLCTGKGSAFKYNGPVDQFFLAHNTFVWEGRRTFKGQILLNSTSRNNLYIKADGRGPVLSANPWSEKVIGVHMPPNHFEPTFKTDVDYDGFDWGEAGKQGAFRWQGKSYPDLKGFSDATGLEKNGRRVSKEEIFSEYAFPAKFLVLKEGSSAVDAGAAVPNVNGDHTGKAPDLGAFELGVPLPHYGPRSPEDAAKWETYWVLRPH